MIDGKNTQQALGNGRVDGLLRAPAHLLAANGLPAEWVPPTTDLLHVVQRLLNAVETMQHRQQLHLLGPTAVVKAMTLGFARALCGRLMAREGLTLSAPCGGAVPKVPGRR